MLFYLVKKYNAAGSLILLLLLSSCRLIPNSLNMKFNDVSFYSVSMAYSSLSRLAESTVEDDYTPCTFFNGTESLPALLKVRGDTAKLYPKKSFTLKYIVDGKETRIALDGSYKDPSLMRNKIVMDSYRRIGLPAPKTESAALYINNEYIGYYTAIHMYDEDYLYDFLGSHSLFKCKFVSMGYDDPLYGYSERKYPNDFDYSSLEYILQKTRDLPDESWNRWLNEYGNIEMLAKYLLIHDFFGVSDTAFKNFYIAVGDTFTILPWDNEASIGRNAYGKIYYGGGAFGAGDNLLTKRLLQEGSPIREEYIKIGREIFSDTSDFVTTVENDIIYNYTIIDSAIFEDKNRFWSYDDFLEEKQFLLDFIERRKKEILTFFNN